VEALSGYSVEGNRRRWCYAAAVGVRGWVGEVTCAHVGPEEASAGRFRVRVGRLSVAHAVDMAAAFLGIAAARGVEASPRGRRWRRPRRGCLGKQSQGCSGLEAARLW
jgi:hypothetical protein